ncbi:myelin basic protein isoform X1 [Pseudoliparis swirei]|uniref:myelin basic protein isoform X1 n=1 Tax=Pseudoliparis swirei TaxID=2059687 RepID=UPI0024BEE905|nr:myelin basic protein isoform X1 [Pseudoliparis swirei]
MATASTSGQSRKKNQSPCLMDQITNFFGGDKKKRTKGSFRGHLSTSPQQSAARRQASENAVVHFFRSFVSSSPRPKSSRWRDVLSLASSPHAAEGAKSPVRRRKDQSTLSKIFNLGETKSRAPPKRWSTIF